MRKLIIIAEIILLSIVNVSAQGSKNIPAVNLKFVRQDTSQIWLRLYNQTDWPIGVDTFSMYSFPSKSVKFKSLLEEGRKQVTLCDGLILNSMPNDRDIADLLYFIEEKFTQNGKLLHSTKTFGDTGASSFIAPGDSIIFSVLTKDISANSDIYVKYHYSWEYEGFVLNSFANDHRTYIRGVDLIEKSQIKSDHAKIL